jgi:hypothetical protein
VNVFSPALLQLTPAVTANAATSAAASTRITRVLVLFFAVIGRAFRLLLPMRGLRRPLSADVIGVTAAVASFRTIGTEIAGASMQR